MPPKPAFLKRVRLRNFKSIVSCDVDLGPITFLVGPNGSGKSNFLDGLRFVSDSLNLTLGEAVRRRGGFESIKYRVPGEPRQCEIRLDFQLSSGASGHYSVRLGSGLDDGIAIIHEQCRVVSGGQLHYYDIQHGKIHGKSFDAGPLAQNDRLYLVPVSSLPEFRPVYDALSGMRFYQPYPPAIRDYRAPGPGRDLEPDASNLASVLKRLHGTDPTAHQRLEQYFTAVLPSAERIETYGDGPSERLTVSLRHAGATVKFGPESLSDGTLRVLAMLTALCYEPRGQADRLLAFEEPEIAIHPGALAVVVSALEEATAHTQVLVSSHSPELLDSTESIGLNALFAVAMDDGATSISRLSSSRKDILRDKLFSIGDLQRLGQLEGMPSGEPAAVSEIFEPI